MQKHAFSASWRYETVFEPIPKESTEEFYYDKTSVQIPYSEDFPKLHYHKKYELGICEGGEGLFISEGGIFHFGAGDLIFAPPGKKHYSRSLSEKNPAVCRFLYIDEAPIDKILSCASFSGEESHSAIPAVIPCSSDAAKLLGSLCDCFIERENAALYVASRIAPLLLDAKRLFPKNKTRAYPLPKVSQNDTAAAVAEYLHLHYSEDISSRELAKSFHISESQLRRRFLKSYGTPPLAYRNAIRIRVGCVLLSETSLSIASVSDALGYKCASDFCRAFKLQRQCSPTDYRRQKTAIKKGDEA